MCKAFLARMNLIVLLLLAATLLVSLALAVPHHAEASFNRRRLIPHEVRAASFRESISETTEKKGQQENRNQCPESSLVVGNAEKLRNEWQRQSLEQAVAIYRNAQICWHDIGALSEEAVAWKGIGDIQILLSESASARDAYSKALELRKALPDRAAEAEATADLALVLGIMGEINGALKQAEASLLLSRTAKDQKREGQALYALGISNYLNGKPALALDYHTKALPLARATQNQELVARVLMAIGYVHHDLDDLEAALGFYAQALSEWQTIGNRWGEAKTLSSIGLVHTLLGDRQKALDALRPTLSIMRQIGDRLSEGATLNNLAYLYQTLGDLETALQYYLEALKTYEKTGFLVGRILGYEYCGDIYALLGQHDEALRAYEEAVVLSRRIQNRLMEADALNGIAALYLSQGKHKLAYGMFREVLAKYKSSNAWRGQSSTLNYLGYYFELSNQLVKASEYYNQALTFAQSSQDNEGTAATLFNLARVNLRLGDLKKARGYVEQCLAINEGSRSKLASHSLRGSYLASVHKHYEFYVDVLMQLHKAHPAEGFDALAMQASEKARSRSLLELLTEAGADIRQGVSLALLDRESSLRRSLNAAAGRRMLLSGDKSQAESESLSKEIKQLTRDLEEIEAEIKTTSPRYGALTRPEPLNLIEIQQKVLDDNSLLLEYALGDERSYLWAITRTEVSSYELPGRAEIERVARKVYALLTANQLRPGENFEQQEARLASDHRELPSQIADLSRMIISPVASKLGQKRLLVVPDGALQYIPFQVLTLPQPYTSSEITPRPLLMDHEIINEPSASTLALLIRETAQRKPARNSVAVFADPVFEANDSRIQVAAVSDPTPAILQFPEVARSFRDMSLTDDGRRIPRLQASRDEADAIMAAAPFWSVFKAMGFEASRATVLKSDLSDYRIVHFATHGFLNDEHPELSGVVLSLFDEKGQPQEGFLRLHDIYNLKLPVDLVVLSACNTGLGKDVRGEGLIGLTRGFMYAGASSVVASLWKVDDDATAELMRLFYNHMLRDGSSPAASLQKAQIEMSQQKRWQSPYYWSGFIIQGQYTSTARVNSFSASRVVLWGGVAAALVIGAFLTWRLRRRGLR